MAVRKAGDRWKAFAVHKGQRKSKVFDTELEAKVWEAEQRAAWGAEEEQEKLRLESAPKGSLGDLYRITCGLDWFGKHLGQADNAERLIRCFFGPDTLPCDIDGRAIDDLVVWLRQSGPGGRGCGNSHIRGYLSALSVMLKRGQRLGMIKHLPLFPEKRVLQLPERRSLVIPDVWLAELLDVMERKEQRLEMAVTLFLCHVGCRVGEAVYRPKNQESDEECPGLSWDRVDLEGRWIHFVDTKSSLPRSIPINKEVFGLLQRVKGLDPHRVFPISYKTFATKYKAAVHQVCDRLGLGPKVRKEWVVHTLRHTRITNMARRRNTAPEIQLWAGHKTLSVTQRYIKLAGIELRGLED